MKIKQLLSYNESYILNSHEYEGGVYFYFINLKDETTSFKGSFISNK